jgi:methyltransferase family protein
MTTSNEVIDQAGAPLPRDSSFSAGSHAAATGSVAPSTVGRRQGLNSSTVAQLCAEITAELERMSANPVSVLEAGGGSATFLRGFDRQFEFTTIDISQEQLDRNSYAVEKIVADLQTFDYGNRQFNVVMCWDVLEHLAAPQSALAKLVSAIPAGGIVIVKGPIPTSLKGLLTRWSPHFLHVLFYKWILGKSNAGKPGHAPFRSELRLEADPDQIRTCLQAAEFEVVNESRFITNQIEMLYEKFPIGYHLFRLVSNCILFLSRGRYGGFVSDFYLIARRATGSSGARSSVLPTNERS